MTMSRVIKMQTTPVPAPPEPVHTFTVEMPESELRLLVSMLSEAYHRGVTSAPAYRAYPGDLTPGLEGVYKLFRYALTTGGHDYVRDWSVYR